MAITKTATIDAITIRPTGHVEIRTKITALDDDGSEIGSRYVRRMIAPADDISGEPQKIQRICQIARS
jgi:hypothetical protein